MIIGCPDKGPLLLGTLIMVEVSLLVALTRVPLLLGTLITIEVSLFVALTWVPLLSGTLITVGFNGGSHFVCGLSSPKIKLQPQI